jgi:endonuclease/exonuclease/phosphatase family metal-dependent hydrolase
MLLKLLTWNVWFNNHENIFRFESILNLTYMLDVDVVCFQEVTPLFMSILSRNDLITLKYSFSKFDYDFTYGSITLVKKKFNATYVTLPFPSKQGRHLLISNIEIYNESIFVANVHLESLDNHIIREQQMKIMNEILQKRKFAIIVGDFNFCSYRNFVDIADRPLENDSIQICLPDYLDVWTTLCPLMKSTYFHGDTNNDTCIGYTYDSIINKMISHKSERARYDRVLVKASSELISDSISLQGVDQIYKRHETDISHSNPIWRSDHFGLLYSFYITTLTTPYFIDSISSTSPSFYLHQQATAKQPSSNTLSNSSPRAFIAFIFVFLALSIVFKRRKRKN